MKFVKTHLSGVWLIDPERCVDHRGYFARTFCAEVFARQGLETQFVQHSISFSRRKGTVRGMHFQTAPHEEVKIVRCIRGAIFDVVIDLRPGSPQRGQHTAVELSRDNMRALYIPKGFAHGFQTLTTDVEVQYLISEAYAPSCSSGVRFDDPSFQIGWPLPVTEISARDQAWPKWAEPATVG